MKNNEFEYETKERERDSLKCLFFHRHLTNGLLILYQVGSCCIYVVFIAENIKAIVNDVIKPETMDVRLIMVIILLPIILINWVNNKSIKIDMNPEQNKINTHTPNNWPMFFFVFVGSEFEVLGAVFNDCQLCYSRFIRYYILFHFP